MEPPASVPSEEQLRQLRDDGKITENEYKDLLGAMRTRPVRDDISAGIADKSTPKSKGGKIAFVLMLVGVTLPFAGFLVIGMLTPPNVGAALGPWFFLGLALEIVALAFGIRSWPDAYAKATVATISGVAALALVLFFLSWVSAIRSERSLIDMEMARAQRDRAQAARQQPLTMEIVELKSYSLDNMEGLVSQSGIRIDKAISSDGNGSLRIDATKSMTIRLFETGDINIENARLIYRANVRTEDVDGQAYLEMICRFPDKGEFFSKGIETPLSGTTEWTTVETPFFLKDGENPDNVKLNLVVEGTGTVWIDEVRLLKGAPI
jgi:hypothetical protein